MEHPLDNAVFNGLISGNSRLGYGTENVKFFLPGISPFAGIRRFEEDCFDELFQTLPAGDKKLLKLPEEVVLPPKFNVTARIPVFQMIGTGLTKTELNTENMYDLQERHVPEMLALTRKMNPGPFSEHTIEFGHYRGIFDNGNLVSMAGRRFHVNDFVEISAVCTYPEFGGRGFGKRLMTDRINDILSGGETAFLHVRAESETPIRLYRKLGFEIRKKFVVYLISV